MMSEFKEKNNKVYLPCLMISKDKLTIILAVRLSNTNNDFFWGVPLYCQDLEAKDFNNEIINAHKCLTAYYRGDFFKFDGTITLSND